MISGASGRAVLNVRPSTALTIAGLMPSLIPVWLWASEEVLTVRRTSRALARNLDQDSGSSAKRPIRKMEPTNLYLRGAPRLMLPSIPRLVAMLTP